MLNSKQQTEMGNLFASDKLVVANTVDLLYFGKNRQWRMGVNKANEFVIENKCSGSWISMHTLIPVNNNNRKDN